MIKLNYFMDKDKHVLINEINLMGKLWQYKYIR